MILVRRSLGLQRLIHLSSTHFTEASTSTKHDLPSSFFLREHIKTSRQKEKLAQLVAEKQMLDEFFGKNEFRELKDSDWHLLLGMSHSDERADYLLTLRQKPEKPALQESTQKISEINQEKYDAGQMVYARNFHSWIELYGQDFRKMIDKVYGARWLSKERMDSLLNLIVDCRYLAQFTAKTQVYFLRQFQAIHDQNWFDKNPFTITFANFRPDSQCAQLMKKNLTFLYGPRRLQDDFESMDEGAAFTPPSFIPTISNQHLSHHADLGNEDTTMYLSWKAVRFLPDEPPATLKNIIICASDDHHPVTGSLTACSAERIIPYRIPFEKFAGALPNSTNSPLSLVTMAAILRDWTTGIGWKATLDKNVTSPKLTDTEWKAKKELLEMEKCFKLAMRDSEIVYRQEKIDERQARMIDASRRKPSDVETARPKIRHRYSREERNARRAVEAETRL